MTVDDIIFIVQMETQVPFSEWQVTEENRRHSKNSAGLDAKCIAATIMNEEGYSKALIGRKLKGNRVMAYSLLARAEKLLSTFPGMKGYDKEFKTLYLACIRQVVTNGDKAA